MFTAQRCTSVFVVLLFILVISAICFKYCGRRVPNHCAQITIRSRSATGTFLEQMNYRFTGMYLHLPGSEISVTPTGPGMCEQCLDCLNLIGKIDFLSLTRLSDPSNALKRLTGLKVSHIALEKAPVKPELFIALQNVGVSNARFTDCIFLESTQDISSWKLCLDSLNIANSTISSNHLERLLRHIKVYKLDVSHTPVERIGGSEWAEIETLWMTGMRIHHMDLGSLIRLRRLSMSASEVPRHVYHDLIHCQHLEFIDLRETELGDEFFFVALKLPNLKMLRLEDTHVTPRAVQEFRRARPNITVTP